MKFGKKTIGVLALQGDFFLHQSAFAELGAATTEVRKPQELKNIAGLVIPGGESTTLQRLMTPLGMQQAIVDFVHSGKALFGTCAGMILVSKNIRDHEDAPASTGLGLLDCDILRNAYGRQLQSQVAHGVVATEFNASLGGSRLNSLEMPFIRAPKVVRVGEKVQVLAQYKNDPVLLRQQRCLLASFHPELSAQRAVQQYFLSMLTED